MCINVNKLMLNSSNMNKTMGYHMDKQILEHHVMNISNKLKQLTSISISCMIIVHQNSGT